MSKVDRYISGRRGRLAAVGLGLACFIVTVMNGDFMLGHSATFVLAAIPQLANLSVCGKHCAGAREYFAGFASALLYIFEWMFLFALARTVRRIIRRRNS
ncbi:MAG: hypothetical protein JST04_01240 [Bdellovibrionales bacterium]|nr:hypothetical protein [Bdellovibrionales bacterium]